MSLKLFLRHKNYFFFCFIALLFADFDTIYGQCAGTDTAITVCDIDSPANQNLDLFNLLGPSATPGGIWTDPTQSGALNLTTGILNIWDIHFSGTLSYTYTVNSPGCADNNATVSVTVGAYTGVPSPNGSACSDDESVNLFQFFVGDNVPAPQFNGVWSDNNNTGALSGSSLDASASGLGTFSFTYSIPAISTCPAMQSTVIVTVYRSPKPGQGQGLAFCETDDLSPYTNLNLFDQVSGEDSNGLWSESGTSELSGIFDSTIDVQHIFDTHGIGTYNFTYTVFPTNPVCIPKSTTVTIEIVKIIDLTGATLTINSDICENEISTATYSAVLTQGVMPIPNGAYELTCHITSASVNGNVPVSGSFQNGVMVFSLPNTLFQQVGPYTVTVTHIEKASGANPCDNIANVPDVLNIFPSPKIDTAVITIDPVCAGAAALVQMTGIGNLANGNYEITYNLGGANEVLNQQLNISVVNGMASFTIPAALLANAGSTAIIITNVLDLQTGCFRSANKFKNFIVNPLPVTANLDVTVANSCANQPASVLVSGMGAINNVSVTYNVSGANTATAQTATFTAVTGAGVFNIPSTLLSNSGATTVTITSVTNVQTGCSNAANEGASFQVYAAPDLTGVTAVINDVCKGQPVAVAVSGLGNVSSITMLYSLSGANNNAGQTINLTVNAGNTGFVIPSGLVPNTGDTIFQIISITTQPNGCIIPLTLSEAFTISPIPDVNNFLVAIPNICKGQDLTVSLLQLGDFDSLAITYNLSGTNTVSAQTQTVTATAGAASLNIPASLLPNTGISVLTITAVSTPVSNCSVTANIIKNFAVNPLLDLANMTISIADVCINKPVPVTIGGLTTATSVTIAYDLSGANVATGQTATINLSNGSGSFIIPPGLLSATGQTIVTINAVVNAQNSCSTPVVNIFDTFSIFLLPDAPAAADVVFCANQHPTVANLQPSGSQYKWYDSATSTTALPGDVALTNGIYYVTQTNSNNCVSEKTMVTVAITELQPPVLNAAGENFCGADNPTLADLSANTVSDNVIIWFDAASDGNQLGDSDLLQEGFTYYGFDFSEATGCASPEALVVTVSLTVCDDDPSAYDFFIPDGFSPNNDNVNDTWRIPDIQFLFPDYTYEIYNRYGNVLFKGNINKPEWNGKNAESSNVIDGIAPNGVYFYVINFNKGNKPPKQGRLYLNR